MREAANIARALGGKQRTGNHGVYYLCRCLVPSHGKGQGDVNPSLSVSDGKTQLLVKCFAGCDPSDILDALKRRGLLGECPQGHRPTPTPASASPAPEHKPDPAALELWAAGARAPGSIVEKYLRARGITIEPPPSLRCSGGSYLDRYALPAMIAAVQAPDRRTIAVQTTLIDPRGDRKAQVRLARKTTGALGWGAVRLAAATDKLGLAEGVEKGLAAMQLLGVPVWATLGAGRMHRVAVPDGVRELYIFPDNDDAGRAAAERTAHAHRHRRVILHFPPDGFKDWDDVTAARAKTEGAAA